MEIPGFSQKIKIPGKSAASCIDRTTTDRQKSHANVHCSHNVEQIRGTETGKSSISTGIIRIHPQITSYGSCSDKSNKKRQKWNLQHQSVPLQSTGGWTLLCDDGPTEIAQCTPMEPTSPLDCIFKSVRKYPPRAWNLMQNSDSRHQGGATCKISGNSDVKF